MIRGIAIDGLVPKCWAVNTLAHLQLMQAAGPIFNANPEGGVYILTSSIAVCIDRAHSRADIREYGGS